MIGFLPRPVLHSIPPELRAKNVIKVPVGSALQTERVLGLLWNTQDDVFIFKLKFNKIEPDLLNGIRIPTKRQCLQLVMLVYDPLGFLSQLLVRAKILLQDIWRSEIGWDDELTDSMNTKWSYWLRQLALIMDIRFPRCYCSTNPDCKNTTLHVFCDASEKAFAAVAYLRFQDENAVHVSFVMSRMRVAPLKPMTIPRLELQAAVMGSRLANTMETSLDIQIKGTMFWTDSSTVLC